MAKKLFILFFCLIMLGGQIKVAQAGFGVSPTYIKSERLRPGTQYERRINLLRSSADEDLEARITIDAPAIGSWISIDKGLTFILPKGELRVPMTVKVAVPPGADLGNYSGQISISTAPAKDWAQGIAVSVGALTDLNLTVTNEIFSDFKIREVKIPDFEILGKPWDNKLFSWLFRRLEVAIRIENTGNVEIAPAKVVLDVYGMPAKAQLDSMASTINKKIKPYNTGELTVSFPSRLGVGQYWGRVKIYKGNEILYNDQIAFTIAAPGTLTGYSSRPGVGKWLIIGAIGILIVIVVIAFKKLGVWRRTFKESNIFLRIRYFIRQRSKAVWLEIKFKFWRRLRDKSALTISKNNGAKRNDQKPS